MFAVTSIYPNVLTPCSAIIISILPFYFFIVAVLLNIAKWVSFNVRILSTVNPSPGSYYNKHIRFVYIATCIVILVPTIIVLTIMGNSCAKSDSEMMTDLFLVSSVLFIIISALFMISGVYLSMTLSKYYEHFYRKTKKMVRS